MGEIVVLHLLSSRKFSGAENVVCQIINAFKQETGFVMVYCSPEGPIRDSLVSRGVQYEAIQSLSIRNVRSVIRKIHPSVIHAHDMGATFIAAMSTCKIPIISHIHNNNFNSRNISLKALLYLYAAKRSKHIFWVSKSSYEGYVFHTKLKKKSSVLYNVIDIAQLEKRALEDTNEYNYDLVYVGRINYLKNPQRLIEICSRVVKQLPSVRIAIIGDGDLREDMLKMIQTYSLTNNITYLGFLNNPYKILQSSKGMIMTSRTEGLPMCALEAMSLGVPIVSTPVGGLVELIDDGADGFLSDDNDILSLALCRLVQDNTYQKIISNNARKKMERIMDLSNYKDELIKFYK